MTACMSIICLLLLHAIVQALHKAVCSSQRKELYVAGLTQGSNAMHYSKRQYGK